ncbi:MAG: hypothetical protein SGPRY_001539, partial [Prymnesium sp.]
MAALPASARGGQAVGLLALGVLPSERPRPHVWELHFRRRAAARATWLTLRPRDVVVRFVVEHPHPSASSERREALLSEEREHDDIASFRTDRGNRSTCLQGELVRWWFIHALTAHPGFRYYGKSEDDIYVHLGLLRFDLARLAAPRLWLGLFQWSGNGKGEAGVSVGCFGGAFEDDPSFSPKREEKLLGQERRELDVRSSELVSICNTCSYPSEWLRGQPRRGCTNDYSASQGLLVAKCVEKQITLAHLTWTKVHSNAADSGWRPFAPPSNLTLALDMNLADKKLRKDIPAAWRHAHAAI